VTLEEFTSSYTPHNRREYELKKKHAFPKEEFYRSDHTPDPQLKKKLPLLIHRDVKRSETMGIPQSIESKLLWSSIGALVSGVAYIVTYDSSIGWDPAINNAAMITAGVSVYLAGKNMYKKILRK
jgi:hypothetical protein